MLKNSPELKRREIFLRIQLPIPGSTTSIHPIDVGDITPGTMYLKPMAAQESGEAYHTVSYKEKHFVH